MPEYDITLTDNIDVVINQIGQIADDVAKLSSTFSTMRDGLNKNLWSELAKKLSKTQDDTAYGNIAFAANVGTPTFVGGFLGEGWRVDQNNNLTLDNLTVRQSMRVFELLVQQVKATGGEIIVSPANGRIKAVVEQEGSGTGGFPLTFPVTFPQAQGDMYVCTIDSGENESHSNKYGNMFQRGDLVRCQRWDMELGIIHSYWVSVYDVQGNDIYLPKNQFSEYGTPEVGDELVLMGSVSNPLRQGVISISATDDGHPRITVLNGINSPNLSGCTRLVLGDLSGITDPDFTGDNEVSGYGLYSDNVFLKGKIVMPNGMLISDEITRITSDEFEVRKVSTIPNPASIEIDGELIENKAKVAIQGSTMEVFGAFGQKNIFFGVDVDGFAVLKYYDNDGNFLYDLGPQGLRYSESAAAGYTSRTFLHSSNSNLTVYRFQAKVNVGAIIADGTYATTDDIARNANGKWFNLEYAPIYETDGAINGLVRGRYWNDSISYNTNISHRYETAEEVKQFFRDEYNATETQINNLNWDGYVDEDTAGWKFTNDVTITLVTTFFSGVMSEAYNFTQQL